MTAPFVFPEGSLGASRALHMQAKGLSEAGHDVVVAVRRGSLDAESAEFDGFRMRSFSPFTEEETCLWRRLSWLRAHVRMLMYLLHSIWKREFGSIVFWGPAPVFGAAAIAAKLRGQQTIYVQGDIQNLRTPLHVLAEIVLARTASLIIVGGSSLLSARLRRIAPGTKQVKLWPPTDTAYFGAADGARARESLNVGEGRLVVYAGAMTSLEGVDVLIRSMTSVVGRIPGARLIIAGFVLGRDPILGAPLQYEKLIDSLGLQNSVVLAGPMSMRAVADLYAAASVLVNPKVDHLANQVAAPIKIGEYLAAGRPVLTTKVCELETWLVDRRDVLFCDAGDPGALAAGICELLTNADLAERLSREGASAARRVCDYRVWGRTVGKAIEEART